MADPQIHHYKMLATNELPVHIDQKDINSKLNTLMIKIHQSL